MAPRYNTRAGKMKTAGKYFSAQLDKLSHRAISKMGWATSEGIELSITGDIPG